MQPNELQYLRICGQHETLATAVADAKAHGADVYLMRGHYFVSTEPVAGAQRIAPVFQPIRHLVAA